MNLGRVQDLCSAMLWLSVVWDTVEVEYAPRQDAIFVRACGALLRFDGPDFASGELRCSWRAAPIARDAHGPKTLTRTFAALLVFLAPDGTAGHRASRETLTRVDRSDSPNA